MFVNGTSTLAGSVQLGTTSGLYTVARTASASGTRGRSTYVLGQAGDVSSNGGDLLLEGGTGGASAGAVVIGRSSGAVTIGASGRVTSVIGPLSTGMPFLAHAVLGLGM